MNFTRPIVAILCTQIRGSSGLEIAMTKPFIPIVLEVVTSSVSLDPANDRRGMLNFTAGANLYSFAIYRAALLRLNRQIDGVLQRIPPLRRKRKLARR